MKTIKLLIVDDYIDNRMLLSQIADILDYKFAYAENGRKAIEVLKEDNAIDIIFMDIEMPVMNGLEATREIRNQLPYPRNCVPIIAITAHHPEQLSSYSNVGFTDFVSKPYTLDKVQSIVDKYLPQF